MKKMLLLIFTIVFCNSCETDFNINNFDIDKKLVLLGAFGPEQKWGMRVSQSYTIFDEVNNTDLYITDAKVRITEIRPDDSEFSYNLTFDGNVYTHPIYTPVSNNKYRIQVEKEGFLTATATSQCPELIRIVEKSFSDEYDVDTNKYNFEIKVDVKASNIQTSDLYSLAVAVLPLGENDYQKALNQLSITTPESFDIQQFFDSYQSEVNLAWESSRQLDDEVLDLVKDYSTHSGIYIGTQGSDDRNTDNRDDVNINPKKYKSVVYVIHLSNQYFQYASSISRYINAKGSAITPNDRPNLYSNVENGYGLFGGIDIEYFVE